MKHSNKISYVEKALNILIILTGLYLVLTIHSLTINALYTSSLLILITFGVIAYMLFPDVRKEPFVIITFLFLIVLFLSFILHCNDVVKNSQQIATCSYKPTTCKSCLTCSYLFLGATILGALALYLRYNRKCEFLKKLRIKIT